jgi:prepilin-type N-terminal cleavage/methylation domain-containing protein
MKNQKGFSLLEFLMSLFVISLLATIGYSQYVSSWENAKQTAIIANMHTIQLSTEDYSTRADGVYPGGINTMICEVSINPDSSVLAGANKPPYPLKSLIPDATVNPIDSTYDAIRNGLARKPAGCVYYYGLGIAGKPAGEGNIAVAYKITAMGPYRPITLVLTSGGKKEAGNETK